MLELRNIQKKFGEHTVLKDVSFSAGPGEVVALLGENGAGKSTLMKILSGIYPTGTYQGEIHLNGSPVCFDSVQDAVRAGVAMIHQELALFPELTVGEHLELEALPAWIDWKSFFERTQGKLDRMGFEISARTKIKDLSPGEQQMVEIARALNQKAELFIFDEPTSALTATEVLKLERLIRELKHQGKIILYITHRMDEVFRLSDRRVVLRDGAITAIFGNAQTRAEQEPDILRAMVGRELSAIYPPKIPARQKVRLSVENLSLFHAGAKRPILDHISFQAFEGEILGLSGLLGAGRSETLRSLFGALGPGETAQGQATLDGAKLQLSDPASAMKQGLAFVTEDRKKSGLVLTHSVRHNFALPSLVHRGGSLFTPLHRTPEQVRVREWMRTLSIRAESSEQIVGTLSGGNQQKVVLAKWLELAPKVLLLDEPTRGVDVGARAEIYAHIVSVAARGMTVLIASSEMPELLGLCHRILVLREGRLSRILQGGEQTEEHIMEAASL